MREYRIRRRVVAYKAAHRLGTNRSSHAVHTPIELAASVACPVAAAAPDAPLGLTALREMSQVANLALQGIDSLFR